LTRAEDPLFAAPPQQQTGLVQQLGLALDEQGLVRVADHVEVVEAAWAPGYEQGMPSPRAPRSPRLTPLHEDFEERRVPVWAGRYERHGRVGCAPLGSFVHSYAVIVLVTRGQARVRHTGELVLRAGDVHLIPPGDPHGAGHLMAEARWRLRGTDERVDIIAERVGYADVTHFIRLFRRVHGLTPAAWRRKAIAGD